MCRLTRIESTSGEERETPSKGSNVLRDRNMRHGKTEMVQTVTKTMYVFEKNFPSFKELKYESLDEQRYISTLFV